ncbi:MAG: hypothetical protein MI743_08960 [Sneathiellales bacterium]|nr:hypothetical protein [Sneathiellales bacterium]
MGFSLARLVQDSFLLLPAVVPSWRFFDEIAPSPRVEYLLLGHEQEEWLEFRPRPEKISIFKMLRRMVWNPTWNESLFLVSCAERLMAEPTDHSANEIFDRISRDLFVANKGMAPAPFLKFRLVFLYRVNGIIERHVTYQSEARALEREGPL